MTPSEWVEFKCLTGCHTDEVPGIPGIGEVSAAQYIQGTLKNVKKKALIESLEGQEIIKRNRALIELPHQRTNPIELKKPELNEKAFQHWMKKYQIESFFHGKKGDGFSLFFSKPQEQMKSIVRKPQGMFNA